MIQPRRAWPRARLPPRDSRPSGDAAPGDAFRHTEPALRGERSTIADLVGIHTSVLDDDEAEQAVARALSSPSVNRCVLCRWLSVAVVCAAAGTAMWYVCDQLFFASARTGTCDATGAVATQTRMWIEWFIGW